MTTANILERKIKDAIKGFFVKHGYNISRIHTEKISDRIVKRKIGDFFLAMREDHQLPIFLKHLPNYSQNLPRLALELFKKYPDLKMIDVGANIGDTVALTRTKCPIPITCIDGDVDFFPTLQENVKQFNNVKAYMHLLGEKQEIVNAEFKRSIETARFKKDGDNASGAAVPVISLDYFIESHNETKHSKLLKIDTDGYDMKIVRGAIRYIEDIKPVIFLEYDPIFFAEQGDNGVETLAMLEKIGYEDIIFYDNFGNLLVSGKLSNHLLLKQLNNCINPKNRTPVPYYDIAVFHSEDKDVAEIFIKNEMKFFYGDKNYIQ